MMGFKDMEGDEQCGAGCDLSPNVWDEQNSGNEEQDFDDRSPVIKTFVNDDGTTSSYFDKRRLKIAPRSTLQFKVGPSFTVVADYCQIIDNCTGLRVDFSLRPRIDRGFDYINYEWIGYKRNYFTLVCSFGVKNMNMHEFLNKSFSMTTLEGHHLSLSVKYFAVRLVAVCDEDNSEINLVQHTAKRDKGPQFAPPVHALIPSELPNHQTIREASNVRNEVKMKKYDSLFFLHRQKVLKEYQPKCLLHTYPDDSIKKVARYERVQFSSSINAKKPSQQNKHFKLRVILGCVIEGIHTTQSSRGPYRGLDCVVGNGTDTFVPITEMETPPLIIRGRSPSNYSCPVKSVAPAKNVRNNYKEETLADGGIMLNSASDSHDINSETNLNKPRKQLNEKATQDTLASNARKRNRAFSGTATCDDTVSMENDDQYINPQTMSYIEAVIIKNLPLVLKSTINTKDFDLLPKTSAALAPVIGMKDIELGPVLRLSPHDPYEQELLSGFKSDPFNIDIADDCAIYHHPHSLAASKLSLVTKKRRLHNKISSSEDPTSCKSPSFNPKEKSGDDSAEFLTLETSYNYQHQVNISRDHDVISIPRSMAPNPMDISFCLNLESETSMLARPFSSAVCTSRRLLTANAKPSDVFGNSELFDEPSFYHH